MNPSTRPTGVGSLLRSSSCDACVTWAADRVPANQALKDLGRAHQKILGGRTKRRPRHGPSEYIYIASRTDAGRAARKPNLSSPQGETPPNVVSGREGPLSYPWTTGPEGRYRGAARRTTCPSCLPISVKILHSHSTTKRKPQRQRHRKQKAELQITDAWC